MANFDLEDFRDYFLNMIKDNLDAKIDEINAAKNDSIVLTKPDASHFLNKIHAQALSFDPFIHYGFSEIEAQSVGGGVLWKPKMFFAFYFIDRDEVVAEAKVLRYTKAMTEIVAARIRDNSMISTPEILPLPPALVVLADQDGTEYKVGGIEIEGSFST